MSESKDIKAEELKMDSIHQYLQILSLRQEWITGLQQCILNEIRKDPLITANRLAEHLGRSYDGQLEPEMASRDEVVKIMREYGYTLYADNETAPQNFDDWNPFEKVKDQAGFNVLEAIENELTAKIRELSSQYSAKKNDVKAALDKLRSKKVIVLQNGKSLHRRYIIDYGMINAFDLGFDPVYSLPRRTAPESIAEITDRTFNNDTPVKQRRRLQYMINKGELKPYTVNSVDKIITFNVPKWIFGIMRCVEDCCLTANEFPETYNFFNSAMKHYDEYCRKYQLCSGFQAFIKDEVIYWRYINRIAHAYYTNEIANPDSTFIARYTSFLEIITLWQDKADDKTISTDLNEMIDSIHTFIVKASDKKVGWGLKSPYLCKQPGEDFLVFYLVWGAVTESMDGLQLQKQKDT